MRVHVGTPLEEGARMQGTKLLLGFAMLTGAVGCAPRVFHDGTTIAVVGTTVPEPVAVVPERIELREKVQFAKNSDRILEVSHAVLDEAVAEIQAHPTIRRIRIEGHASADGNDAHNLELSTRRAQAVRAYLVEHGVAAEILEAEGIGENRPIADNDSPEGRERNRRVELHVTEVAGAGSDAAGTP
jgi:outer membrane protein OmpA-like peptidoglycan-associated protein